MKAIPIFFYLLFFSIISTKQIRVLKVKGNTNYEIGYSIGKTFSKEFSEALNKDQDFQKILDWANNEGKDTFDLVVQQQKNLFPHIYEELMGMSDASGIDLKNLLVENLEPDLYNLVFNVSKNHDHCSDVLLLENSKRGHGHNEGKKKFQKKNFNPIDFLFFLDDDQFWMNLTFLVETENWIAFTYASQLAGN